MSPSAPAPSRINIRSYNDGFGDNYLLSLAYPSKVKGRAERHVLIDFGTTRFPPGSEITHAKIAKDIAGRTDGKLDAIVVTHRHKDHLSGFEDEEAASVIASLEPDLVIRPWTDDPGAAADAKGPKPPAARSRAFAAGLDSAQEFAETVTRSIARRDDRSLQGQLWQAADQQLPNPVALKNLEEIAKKASFGARYVYAGADSGVEAVLPGVKARVLGPPTVEQWPRVAGQRADDPEYWMRQRQLFGRMLSSAETAEEPTADPTVRKPPPPGPVRWIVEKMADQHAHSLLRIVRTLDDALNNTSVILQFEVGSRRLLFPGDAQIENWSYALDPKNAAKLGAKLDDIDLYKVGHHGSRNGTPKSLYARWRKRKPPFAAMMSTLPGVHGRSKETQVPLQLLTEALTRLGPLYRTDELPKGRLYLETTAPTSGRERFRLKKDG